MPMADSDAERKRQNGLLPSTMTEPRCLIEVDRIEGMFPAGFVAHRRCYNRALTPTLRPERGGPCHSKFALFSYGTSAALFGPIVELSSPTHQRSSWSRGEASAGGARSTPRCSSARPRSLPCRDHDAYRSALMARLSQRRDRLSSFPGIAEVSFRQS